MRTFELRRVLGLTLVSLTAVVAGCGGSDDASSLFTDSASAGGSSDAGAGGTSSTQTGGASGTSAGAAGGATAGSGGHAAGTAGTSTNAGAGGTSTGGAGGKGQGGKGDGGKGGKAGANAGGAGGTQAQGGASTQGGAGGSAGEGGASTQGGAGGSSAGTSSEGGASSVGGASSEGGASTQGGAGGSTAGTSSEGGATSVGAGGANAGGAATGGASQGGAAGSGQAGGGAGGASMCGSLPTNGATCDMCLDTNCCAQSAACAGDPNCLLCLVPNPPATCFLNSTAVAFGTCVMQHCQDVCMFDGGTGGAGGGSTKACDVVKQDCSNGQKCTDVTVNNQVVAACESSTSATEVGEGQTCSRTSLGHDNCKAGLECTVVGNPNATSTDPATVCRKFCAADGDCGSGQACLLFSDEMPPDGICVPTCNAFDATCKASNGSAKASCADERTGIDGATEVLVCRGVDTNGGNPGATCQDDYQCAPNEICFSPTGQQSTCHALCDDKDKCSNNGQCVPQDGLANGAGYCE